MSRPLRVTEVVTTDSFAGTERYVVAVARGLAARGHEVAVVGGAPAEMTSALEGLASWSPGASTCETLTSLIRGGRRHVVHSHLTKADFCAFAAAAATGGTRVSTRHIATARGWSPTAKRLAPLVRNGLACEIAVSEYVSRSLERPADLVLLNGVPPVAAPVQSRNKTVLVAQRLAPEKQTATALHAFSLSGLGGRGWRLRVAGSGQEQFELTRLSDALGIGAVTDWLGWSSDPGALYQREGVLLAPALAEPCGLSVLEAMAAGMPVVASGSGGHLETIGQLPSARLFVPGDAAGAADHLVSLAADDDARAVYGRQLRTLQQAHFTLQGHLDQLERVYGRVLHPTAVTL